MFEGLVDALLDEFMPRIQRYLLEPRLLLDLRPACRGGLFRGGLICIRHRRSLGGRRYQCHMAYNDRGDNARTKCGDELRHDDALFLAELSDCTVLRVEPQRPHNAAFRKYRKYHCCPVKN
jgi:hypothetical protein